MLSESTPRRHKTWTTLQWMKHRARCAAAAPQTHRALLAHDWYFILLEPSPHPHAAVLAVRLEGFAAARAAAGLAACAGPRTPQLRALWLS